MRRCSAVTPIFVGGRHDADTTEKTLAPGVTPGPAGLFHQLSCRLVALQCAVEDWRPLTIAALRSFDQVEIDFGVHRGVAVVVYGVAPVGFDAQNQRIGMFVHTCTQPSAAGGVGQIVTASWQRQFKIQHP